MPTYGYGMATTTNRSSGFDLRRTRERLGVSRVQLAALAGCSLASLANIETGAVPRRSRVLAAAWEAIEQIDERRPVGAAAKIGQDGPTHAEE
jgi:predicted transcriptional regulator